MSYRSLTIFNQKKKKKESIFSKKLILSWMNFTKELSLDRIRQELIRLEDSILFSLIERAQFAHNVVVYQPGQLGFNDGSDISFLDHMLQEIESVHGKCFLN